MGNPNDAARRHLKNQMDLLSDNHSEITNEAARINAFMAEDRNALTRASMSKRSLTRLEESLVEQANRCLRVRAEIMQIKDNLKVS